jgi:hypothetical protein
MATIRAVYFVGPSLYGVKVDRNNSHELWLPPARQGELLSTMLRFRPSVVVLIDGVFHQSQSVWHKEIGYALMRGVVVIGAASMGALRAAEMHRYGMIGIGEVYKRYRDGEEDDSLVAMSFDPTTYKPLSNAVVGQDQKRCDALEAIEFARSYRVRPSTTLTIESISPFFERMILSTLEQQHARRRTQSQL